MFLLSIAELRSALAPFLEELKSQGIEIATEESIVGEPTFDDFDKVLVKANQKDHDIWFEYVFLSWQWWFCVILSIIPWILWWKFRKKESTHRLLYGAFFMMFISMFLDSFGAELGYWDYRYEPLPFLPSFVPWDLSLLPISFLILVQIKPTISPILK